jgi:hypothetical protein
MGGYRESTTCAERREATPPSCRKWCLITLMSVLPLLCMVILAGVPREVSGQDPRLAVEIRSEQDNVRAGDEILITFVITNIGTTSYKYTDRNYDRSGRMGEYRLRAYDERGTPVADPRTLSRVPQGYVGGGLGTFSELEPGQRFSKRIALNLWAFVVEPGVYTVRGSYAMDSGTTAESAPLTLRVLPRSDEQMRRYIDELAAQLRHATEREMREQLVQRLMYTADRRAAQRLIEVADQDDNTAFWIGEAFSYYFPKDAVLLDHAVRTIRRRGLSPSSVRVLEQLQAPRETIEELIGLSLTSGNDAVRAEAALAAQRFPDDRLMEGLIQLATNGSVGTRVRAIYGIAFNRTDAGVAALRSLRRDANPEIRTTTERAIAGAYEMSSGAPGRRLRADDFPDVAKR